MIEATDIANAFCEDIEGQLHHPKCVTFYMTPEQVYDKVEEIWQRASEATEGREDTEFSESLLWETIAAIKRHCPQLLQDDNSICKTVKDCTVCHMRPGEQIHNNQLMCPQCRQQVRELEGEELTSQTILQCCLCHSTEGLTAHLDVIYCPECLHMVKQITKGK